MNRCLQRICQKYKVCKTVELDTGFSKDKKFVLQSINGEKYILRFCDMALYERRKRQVEMLSKLDTTINRSEILELGSYDEETCFLVTTFLNGSDAIDVVKEMDEKDAYVMGLKAGEILLKWHGTAVETSQIDWYEYYQNKKLIQSLSSCKYRVPLQEKLLAYYRDHLYLMKNRPIVFCHGDYHLDNFIMDNGELGIIDVLNCSLADPYEELKRSAYWDAAGNQYFLSGMIHGYFCDCVPSDFFPILKFYLIETMFTRLLSVKNREGAEKVQRINEWQMQCWGNFDYNVPTWYIKLPLR